ncbi:efflux transporter outer membrane subunit [Neokomagataea tanensis]|uniref:Efflux transporter outer membrane subunit n=3 Tax=Acetobacteraceae TaxID=433 RepID=A0A4Y6VBQ5_9PROT|nr:efflux transporter outer membrane subunit [Neokomagataea tanensis]
MNPGSVCSKRLSAGKVAFKGLTVRAISYLRALSSGAAVMALSGCLHVGPEYHAPKPWAPEHYNNADKRSPISDPRETAFSAQWWDVFHDAELTSLENRLVQQNLSFRLATANLAQSRAQLIMAGAERFPGLSASGSYQRSQFSSKFAQEAIGQVGSSLGNGAIGQAAQRASSTTEIPQLDQWRDGIDATYEIDLWGRVAHQYDAAKADLAASDEERRGVLIAQQADMARAYLTLRGDQTRLQVLEGNLATLKQFQSLAQARYRAGLVSELDVDAAQGRVHETESRIAQMGQAVAQEENAVAFLLGNVPGSLHAELSAHPLPVVPPFVPVGLPSELARRRPDIREAEAKLRGAVAQVGEATADFYPKITISADFGFQSLSFRDLGFWNARAWNVGPSISLPIFQGGRLRGQLALKEYEQKAAAINYQKTVLQAWHDVDNALIAYRSEQLNHEGLAKAVADNQRSLSLAKSQYRSGLTTYLNVLNAQTQLQSSQLSLAESDCSIATDLARLYNALGGGWESVLPESDLSKRPLSAVSPGP